MKTMWKVLGIFGVGAGVGMLAYSKLQNTECMTDMKDTLDNITKKTSKTMKDMTK